MKAFSSKRIACALFLCVAAFAVADDDHDKDHHHHEDLTEAQLGTVHFPVSCAESVQKSFARGVALLHSFWYEESEKEFLDIAKDDPHCAMAHWGIAMSLWHQLWDQPGEKVVKRGLKEVKKGEKLAKGTTPRGGRGFLQQLQETQARGAREDLLRRDEEGLRVQSRRSRSCHLLRTLPHCL